MLSYEIINIDRCFFPSISRLKYDYPELRSLISSDLYWFGIVHVI